MERNLGVEQSSNQTKSDTPTLQPLPRPGDTSSLLEAIIHLKDCQYGVQHAGTHTSPSHARAWSALWVWVHTKLEHPHVQEQLHISRGSHALKRRAMGLYLTFPVRAGACACNSKLCVCLGEGIRVTCEQLQKGSSKFVGVR